MTHSAVVLVTCKPNYVDSTKKSLDVLPQVNTVSQVSGAYDIVAKITSSSTSELKDTISTQIKKLPNVRSTLTLRILNQ